MSAPVLDVRLFGLPNFTVQGKPMPLPAAKPFALLCYLVATRQVHSRDRLAAFFWPDATGRGGLANLRTALYDIRRGLGARAEDYLFVERARVAFVADSPHALDLATLEAAGSDTSSIEMLKAAVEAYGGEFLSGIAAGDAFEFDDWVYLERERLTHLYLNLLCRLGRHHEERSDWASAINVARRVLAVDPLREDVHRTLIRHLASGGQRAAALAQYKTCAQLLDQELGIEPLAATRELYQHLLANESLPVEVGAVAPASVSPTPMARAAAARHAGSAADPVVTLETDHLLIGRSSERRALQAAWAAAVAGRGGTLVVAGEAGIGKTRLVAEFSKGAVAAEPGARFLVGRCHESTVSEPYAPVIDAIRRALPTLDLHGLEIAPVWLRELARLVPEIASELPEGEAIDLDGVRDRERLFEAVRVLLAALASQGPLLLVVEDAHWSDETSLSLLATLPQQLRDQRLLMVATCRGEDLGQGRRGALRALATGGRWMDLAPLTADEAAELVAALSGTTAPPAQFGSALFHQTGGNPFFMVETLRALHDQGSLHDSGAGWTTTAQAAESKYVALPIPASVGLIVDARLDRLSDDARSLLDTAAVLRRDFSFDLVQTTSGLPAPAALDALDLLLTRGILRESPDPYDGWSARYDFAHALVRDRAYGALSGARRQYLHRQIAGLLESATPPAPDRVAYHYLRGGVRDRACAWSIRAGEAALKVYGGEDALAHFQAARQLAVSPAEEFAALLGAGDAAMSLGRPAEAILSYQTAQPAAGDGAAAADLHRRIGRAEERQGAYDRALVAYGAARESLGGAQSPAAVRVVDGIATVYLRLDRHAEAAELCTEALAWPIATSQDEDGWRAEAWLRNTLGMARMQAGDFPAAIRELEGSLAQKRRLGDRLGEATLQNNLGVVSYHCGDDATAMLHYAASLAIKEEIGDRYGAAIALTNLALMETHLGQTDAAQSHLQQALQTATAVGAAWLMPEIHRVAAQLALRLGQTEQAVAAAQQALLAAESLGVPAFIGVAHRVLGRVQALAVGDAAVADEHFRTSLAVFEMLENEHELAKTRTDYGEALLAHGRSDDAALHLAQAMETFGRTGASGRRERVAHLLRSRSDT